MNTTRHYTTKDVDMLLTASTIIESAITNKTFLQTKRSTWADPFFEDLKTKINTAIQTYLGVDSAKDLRQSTQAILDLQKQALTDLAEAKVQITEDFKSNPPKQTEILTQLGFSGYHKNAQKGDQEALINLLLQFKTNLTETLKNEIAAAGTAPIILDTITAYAGTLKDADVTQENYKGLRKTITAAALKEFNEIYDQVISISKISAKFFKNQPEIQAQFSYNKVAKALNYTGKAKPKTPPTNK
jgi:hypothetical protein